MSKSTSDDSTLEALIARCIRSANKIELHDSYLTSDPPYVAWQASGKVDGAQAYGEWIDIARSATDRGVAMRRTRIISEPVSQYIRFEHAVTDAVNIAAGEVIRWLPRHIFDDHSVCFSYFSGEGEFVRDEVIDDPTIVKQCARAFDLVWERGVDHQDYLLI